LAQLNATLPILPAALASAAEKPLVQSDSAFAPIVVDPPVQRTPNTVNIKRATPTDTTTALNQNVEAKPTISFEGKSDLIHAGVFSQPLLPLSEVTDTENAVLNKALRSYVALRGESRFAAIENYLLQNPSSPYAAALQLNLGLNYYTSAYFGKALTAYESAWRLAKDFSSDSGRIIADRAFGELAYLHSRLGHFEELKRLFKDVQGREFRGGSTELVAAARQGLATMIHRPEIAFRCGPAALGSIFRTGNPTTPIPAAILEAKSSQQGIALSEVQQIAKKAGMDFQIAKREVGAPLVYPAVIHWKIGHFAALLGNNGGINTLQDATFNSIYAASNSAIDSEGSGYFLVPSGKLPDGWRPVSAEEAASIWGKGQPDINDPDRTREDDKKIPECQNSGGMAVASVHAMACSLSITDTPVGYDVPYGPDVQFRATYNQREAKQPGVFNFTNMGNKWNANVISYISFISINYIVGENLSVTIDYPIVHLPGGGIESYVPKYPTWTAPLPIEPTSRCWMTRLPDGSWVRNAPNGSKMVFKIASGVTVPGKFYFSGGSMDVSHTGFFLFQKVDPAGSAATFGYDYPTVNSAAAARLLSITDAAGLVTTFGYTLAGDPLKITSVTDPYGRVAQLAYVNGRLVSITDTIGLVSQFGYQGNSDFISSLTTPYGTSVFAYGEEGNGRWLELTDPQGDKERVEYPPYFTNATFPNAHPGFPNSAAPAGMTISGYTHTVTYYWDKKAMREAPRKPESAKQYSWLVSGYSANTASGTLGAEKRAFENPVYFNYQNQPNGTTEGDFQQPLRVGRVLDDGSSQVYQYAYNPLGHISKVTDPLGRETTYLYESNTSSSGYSIDLREVRQKTGPNAGDYEVLSRFTYNAQRLPLTVTDAAGQVTTYTYNSVGQPITITNAKGETTTLWYHITGNPSDPTFPYNPAAPRDPNAKGYLVRVDGPLAGQTDSVAMTYDGFGRLRTTTDTQGFTITTDYDAFNRPTALTYPDGTYEQYVYNRLDLRQSRDRQGRWSQFRHNAIRQLTLAQDPLQRVTQYLWCKCGDLRQIIDPLGRITEWSHDVGGRIMAKTYHDGTQVKYTYENTISRLKATTDPKGQVTRFKYNADNSLQEISYTDLAGAPLVPATPTVGYSYDPYYPRATGMTDAFGSTAYAYHPISSTPALGAGMLASIDGPWTDDTVSFGYDELGRVINQSVNGSANTSTVAYDTLGRLQNLTNPLGSFTYVYAGISNQLDRIEYPNGQVTQYGFYPNTGTPGTGNGDRRLQQMENRKPGGATLSKFTYTFDIDGQIKTWGRQSDSGPLLSSSFRYDAVDQLLEASVQTTPSTTENHLYRYDRAGNRTSSQLGNQIESHAHNNLNQLTSRSPSGPVRVSGTLDEAATVTVNGQPATVDTANVFTADVPLSPGAQTLAVVAKDYNLNTTTKNYAITIPSGPSATLAYDLNGNLTSDGAGRTFEWDAADRLIKITQGANVTVFLYNGNGQRVQEKLNGALVKQWIWSDGVQPVEERNASNQVTRRYYPTGQQNIAYSPGPIVTNLLTVFDHLGSIRELTDSTGSVRARYDYSPYGERIKVSGDLDAAFGFMGYLTHESGLNFTLFRAYDAKLGRWLSRDKLGENGPDGPNVYSFVSNNPINYVDPLGLFQGSAGSAAASVFVRSTAVGSRGGVVGTVAGVSFGIGYGIGTWIDRSFNVSDRIADWINGPTPVTNMSRPSEKDKSTDVPSWARPFRRNHNESCGEFAERLLNEKYGCGNWRTGPGSEYSKIKKWCERSGLM
jgi:RHS repeat-associated protein